MPQVLKSILITPEQSDWLDAKSRERKISISALVRKMIDIHRTREVPGVVSSNQETKA